MSTVTCHERGETRNHWSPRPDGLEESVQFIPGYNCRARGPHSHGVHGMEIRWHLRGPAGAVWLSMFTDWIPGERTPGHGLSPSGLNENWDHFPAGAGLGWHSRVPRYEGHEINPENCDVLGVPCYGDMSFGGADEHVKRFVAEGEQVIWDALEAAYAELKTGQEASA